MRTFRKLAVLLVLFGVANRAAADEGVRFQPDLDSAIRLAQQTHRLVLIHFGATWCVPCRHVEANVFSQADVGRALDGRFVMVKIDVDTNQALASKYSVNRFPTDLIITPEGEVVAKLISQQNPADYVAQIDRAVSDRTTPQGQFAGAPAPGYSQQSNAPVSIAPYVTAPQQNYQAGPPAGQSAPFAGLEPRPTAQPPVAAQPVGYALPQYNQPAQQAGPPAQQYGPPAQQYGPPAQQYVASAQQTAAPLQQIGPYGAAPAGGASEFRVASAPVAYQRPAAVAAPQQLPPRGLDGFCPVTLTEQKKWVPGDVRFGVVHRGCLYLFASAVEQQKFLANPDRFSPALSGNDPVLFDQGQIVPGQRKYGYYYNGRTYLFSCKETLEQFGHDPRNAERYAEHALQAETPATTALR